MAAPNRNRDVPTPFSAEPVVSSMRPGNILPGVLENPLAHLAGPGCRPDPGFFVPVGRASPARGALR